MNVTHTPLIGRDGNIFECSASITVQSRAGFNVISKTVQNVHGDIDTDCRKPVESHGSPDLLNSNSFTKSPMMINGRLEQFGDISKMILKWGEEEESFSAKGVKGEKGGRRRSQRIDELCGQFELRVDGQIDNPDTDGGGRREGEGGEFPSCNQNMNFGPKLKRRTDNFENLEKGGGCENQIQSQLPDKLAENWLGN